MKNLIVFFFLVIGCFVVFGCNPDEEVDPCTGVSYQTIREQGMFSFLFLDIYGNSLLDNTHGIYDSEDIIVTRSDGVEIFYSIEPHGGSVTTETALHYIDADMLALTNPKEIELLIQLEPSDIDTIIFEYDLIEEERRCGTTTIIDNCKITYQDSVYFDGKNKDRLITIFSKKY